ncbi:hypothetical protein [Anabaena sp. CCY 0017]|uniref:hypothetical protein n=1 Tax=Anabaena sp. CCY 0017 TaxID=3103866 RepID=UPI0039C73CAE
MSIFPARRPEWLLEQLADPFEIFPIQGVADTIADAVDQAEMQMSNYGGWAARKYWTAETAHYNDEVGLLIGSIFVLGQAAITRTLSILSELQNDGRAEGLRHLNKLEKMSTHSQTDPSVNLSKIVIIDTAANYFKHVYEWPENWDETLAKPNQKKTISTAIKIGMRPGSLTDNLLQAHRCLSVAPIEARVIPNIIQDWRECWAEKLYLAFGYNR